MKKVFVLVVALVVLFSSLAIVWSMQVSGPVVHPDPVNIEFSEMNDARGPVRVKGTAHYVARVKQTSPATLFSDEKTVVSYGLFEKGDITSKEIHILVRTEVPIPKNTDFAYVALEGILEEPTRLTVPFQMERVIGERSGYFFSPDLLVLQAWNQEIIPVD